MIIAASVGIGVIVAFAVTLMVMFRRVVEPSEVHIVQSARGTYAYGAKEAGLETSGNSYYAWPSWIPLIGVQVRVLPLSVFSLELQGYEAYDVGKVPFQVDVVAFFRIAQPAVAAARIDDLDELYQQLEKILQGAARTILAQHDVESIMLERSKFGEMFTAETADQLEAWGVANVKNIELMDVRDARDSKTISNIMAKKASHIEMQSRKEVAANKKQAEMAEIEARQEVAIRDQEAQQRVGERAAEKERQVGIAQEKSVQEVKLEAKLTKEREMNVLAVEHVRSAEIEKQQQIVVAEKEQAIMALLAEGEKKKSILIAEGTLEAAKRDAEGIQARGAAEAEAKRLAEMATVSPQVELAREIGENQGYQTYLVQIRSIERDERVGVEQAKALHQADIKVIANTGSGVVTNGLDSVRSLLSTEGGTAVGSMLEAVAQSPHGKAIVERLTGSPERSMLEKR